MIDYAALKTEIGKPEYNGLTDKEIADKLLSATVTLPGEGNITPSEFFARFTPSQARAIATVAESDENVFYFWKQLDLAQGRIDLHDPRITQGLGLLVMKGLITAGDVPKVTATATGKTVSLAETFGYVVGVHDMEQEILAARKVS